MKNISLALGIGYIMLMTGLAWGQVGQIPECDGLPFTWKIPATMFIMLACAMYAGYSAGKE